MRPANDNAVRAHPLAVSSANCVDMTGMSWTWIVRFARAQGVPVWRVGTRKQLVPAAALLAAMERAAADALPASFDDEVEAFKAEIARKMRG